MDRVTRRLIVAFVVLVILCGTLFAFLIGYSFGVQQIPKPVKGVYNITLEGSKVTITTNLKYIDWRQAEDKLIIYGEPTFDEVE